MDADLSHDPKELINFNKCLENYPFVIGSRYIAGGKCLMKGPRLIMSKLGNLVIKICNIMNNIYKQNIDYKKLIKFVRDRPGHDYKYSINSNKLRKNLNFKNSYKFDESLYITIDWYLNNKKWLYKKKNSIEK